MSTKTLVTRDASLTEPQIWIEGDQIALQIPIPHVVTGITGTPTMKFFKANTTTDLSSTYFTGSMSVIGTNTIQCKTSQNLKAGSYVLSVTAVVDGQTYVTARVPIIVKREGDL